MAIDFYGLSNTQLNTRIRSVSASDAVGHKQATAPSSPSASQVVDRVELSQEARNLAALGRSEGSKETFNEAKVQAIRSALADGSYQVDYQKLAANLVGFESQLEA
ncbi:negative regulator of flagellin synthesis FlgM [Allopseudospirillum japonicum]|uniref:Negative regulator of flagellin synthesis n=1 Tax=Allopseudospirillum japonicum TaxID=64971 RepID=A0A1H6QN17_9GAMM|nr:flagellar biosynthesis anti-sigma factor FlgM [Allopseudospirillum japonicum]SEI44973.1 negative regulator of flagellin synthesis FlgM [Allopseudospirillum japonicum]